MKSNFPIAIVIAIVAIGLSPAAKPQPAQAPNSTVNHLDPAAQFAQGQLALQSGHLSAAEAAFRKVLSADPRSGAAYANLGVIAMRRKQWDLALPLLQKAAALDSKMTGVRLNI